MSDRFLEDDTSRNRAARDRDRAYPRDTSAVDDDRKRRQLPARGEFRDDLSSRQRKDRSAAKRRLLADAPRSQVSEMQWAIRDPDRWKHLKSSLREATGDAQQLPERDRKSVQRINRLSQSYERDSERGLWCISESE